MMKWLLSARKVCFEKTYSFFHGKACERNDILNCFSESPKKLLVQTVPSTSEQLREFLTPFVKDESSNSQVSQNLENSCNSTNLTQETIVVDDVEDEDPHCDEQLSQETSREDTIASKFEMLCSLFPKVDPDSLYIAAETFSTEEEFTAWVGEHLETNGRGLPNRENYDKNVQVRFLG